MKTTERGAFGENIAEDYLRSKGFQVLQRNFRTKLGEIDLVAKKNGEIYFCEVRWRGKGSLVEAAETINWRKQEKIRKTALIFLRQHEKQFGREPPPCHFSVLALDQRDELNVAWWEDAF